MAFYYGRCCLSRVGHGGGAGEQCLTVTVLPVLELGQPQLFANDVGFGLFRNGMLIRCLNIWLNHVRGIQGGATLNALHVGAVPVLFQGQVAAASRARFGSYQTEHIPPLMTGHFSQQ